MPGRILDKGTVAFQAEGRLLQELGERLVARPEVALVELIKNAYDADSSSCEVRLEEADKTLVVADDGHGMTFDEFVMKWMRIATGGKAKQRTSRKYHRGLTGAKGIGRFAVRFLGNHLTLSTVSYDPARKMKTRLTASFDWRRIDKEEDIRNTKVNYRVVGEPAGTPTGTTLTIRRLKGSTAFTTRSTLRGEVLKIVTPLQGLDAGKFARDLNSRKGDPGFNVVLPGEVDSSANEVDVANFVLSNHWARLRITLVGRRLTYKVWFSNSQKQASLTLVVENSLSAGFVADVRYFPRRKGVFRAKGINGRAAWQWVRANHGVAVVDRGFRIIPYGYENDDWLHLDVDKAHSERDWRSQISRENFPIPPRVRGRPADNPALYLPYNYQLVGAVFVKSQRKERVGNDLIPSMDREGLLNNRGFLQLVEYVRGGIEFLAVHDKRELDAAVAKEAREATRSARNDVRKAIAFIKKSPTLTTTDKSRIVRVYTQLAERIEKAEDYSVQARRSLMTMSLLGVVAGFMTHESKSLIFEMEKAVSTITALARRHSELRGVAEELNKRLETFKSHLQYTQLFVDGARGARVARMSAPGQIRHVLKRFGTFADDHGVRVLVETKPDVETPAMSPAVYSGIILNLYTNALKAVLGVSSSIRDPKVAIRAWTETGRHNLEVADNGVGIPPEVRKRIWDPLYTTTSDDGNPLGSGMGLGLSLVKEVVENVGGRIILAEDPPAGFNTCFRVSLPME